MWRRKHWKEKYSRQCPLSLIPTARQSSFSEVKIKETEGKQESWVMWQEEIFFLVGEELTFLSKCMSMNTQSSCCPKGRYLNWHSQEMIKFHIWYIPCFLAKWKELMLSLWIRGWSILHKWLDSLHVSFPQDLCFNSRVCFLEAKVSFPIYFEAIMAGAHGKAAHVIVVGMEEMWRKRLGFHHHFQVQVPRTPILPGRWAVLL